MNFCSGLLGENVTSDYDESIIRKLWGKCESISHWLANGWGQLSHTRSKSKQCNAPSERHIKWGDWLLAVCLTQKILGSILGCPSLAMRSSSSFRLASPSSSIGNRSTTAFTGFGTNARSYIRRLGKANINNEATNTSSSNPYMSTKRAWDATRPAFLAHYKFDSKFISFALRRTCSQSWKSIKNQVLNTARLRVFWMFTCLRIAFKGDPAIILLCCHFFR